MLYEVITAVPRNVEAGRHRRRVARLPDERAADRVLLHVTVFVIGLGDVVPASGHVAAHAGQAQSCRLAHRKGDRSIDIDPVVPAVEHREIAARILAHGRQTRDSYNFV